MLHLAITAFAVPPLDPERRRRYSRFAVWVGKRTPLCNSPATSLAQMQQPRANLRMEVDNEELPSAASSGSRPGCPLARGYTGSTSTMCSRPIAASISDSWLARAATSRPATTTNRFAAHAPVQHRELVAQHEDLQVPGGGVAGDRASSRMKRRHRVGESRQHRWPSSWGSVTAPNRVSMRTRSSQSRPSFRHPTDSSAGCYQRDWCRLRAAGRATSHARGGALSPPVRLAGRGSPTDSSDLADGRKAPSGGRLSACRSTPFATCRWPG
jgi:hypothetical protein